VYDQDEDGLISAEELYELLHSFLGSSYSDHQLQTVVQATMRKVGGGYGAMCMPHAHGMDLSGQQDACEETQGTWHWLTFVHCDPSWH
jgi:hypothetical protein